MNSYRTIDQRLKAWCKMDSPMKKGLLFSFLITACGLVLYQYATISTSHAVEVAKTDQQPESMVDPVAETPPPGMLPNALLSLSVESDTFPRRAFLVDKRRRTLTVWEGDGKKLKLLGAYPTDIGQKEGDKLVQGDHRTPEGIYFFQETMDGYKVDFNQYGSRIFTLDYPNYFDNLEKKTGNGIWLHSIPESKSLLRGSRGCVVVRNVVIQELAKYIDLKQTPIVIVGTVDYLSEADWHAQQAGMRSWLEAWRQAWGGKDLDAYMAKYSERFRSNGMNKKNWRRYKAGLADKYSFIEVALNDVQIFSIGPKLVFRFMQNYKSDVIADSGTKILYMLKDGDQYGIIGENWQTLSPKNQMAKRAAKVRAAAAVDGGASTGNSNAGSSTN